jgi:hypothetical protein
MQSMFLRFSGWLRSCENIEKEPPAHLLLMTTKEMGQQWGRTNWRRGETATTGWAGPRYGAPRGILAKFSWFRGKKPVKRKSIKILTSDLDKVFHPAAPI